MHAGAGLSQLPDDCRLLPIIQVAAALNTTERRARQLLAEASLPIVELGPRSHGVRVAHVRELLKRREVKAA